MGLPSFAIPTRGSSGWFVQFLSDAVRNPREAIRTAQVLVAKTGDVLVTEGPQRVLERVNGELQRLNNLGEPLLGSGATLSDLNRQYAEWRLRHRLGDEDISRCQAESRQLAYRP
jgi:hypothetical protein